VKFIIIERGTNRAEGTVRKITVFIYYSSQSEWTKAEPSIKDVCKFINSVLKAINGWKRYFISKSNRARKDETYQDIAQFCPFRQAGERSRKIHMVKWKLWQWIFEERSLHFADCRDNPGSDWYSDAGYHLHAPHLGFASIGSGDRRINCRSEGSYM